MCVNLRLLILTLVLLGACSGRSAVPPGSGTHPNVIELRIPYDNKLSPVFKKEEIKILIKDLRVLNNVATSIRVFVDQEGVSESTDITSGNYVSSFVVTPPTNAGGNYTLSVTSHLKKLEGRIKEKGFLLVSLVAMPLYPEDPKPQISVSAIEFN
jgi:hypothetical protein